MMVTAVTMQLGAGFLKRNPSDRIQRSVECIEYSYWIGKAGGIIRGFHNYVAGEFAFAFGADYITQKHT